jgi:hypothetical protein
MPETARWFGGFIRWLLKGCKTSLSDEIHGRLEPTWGKNYDFENYIIGLVSMSIIIGIVVLCFF